MGLLSADVSSDPSVTAEPASSLRRWILDVPLATIAILSPGVARESPTAGNRLAGAVGVAGPSRSARSS